MKRATPLVLSALSLCVACERSAPAPEAEKSAAPTASHASLPAGEAITAAPLYDLELTLTDQHGKSVGLDVFAGHPVVISMFYGTCPFACPTLISDIKRLERSLDPATRKDLRVLLVSFDPERDTPEKLSALARVHRLDPERYKLARAPESQVRELSAVLGIKYRKLENGAFNHSSVITLLDRRGRPAGRVDGLNQPLENLADSLRRLKDS